MAISYVRPMQSKHVWNKCLFFFNSKANYSKLDGDLLF